MSHSSRGRVKAGCFRKSCCRKSWGGKSDKLQPLWHGYCTGRTLKSCPDWAELHVLYPGHRHDLGTAQQLCLGHLPWSHTGITNLAPGDQHLTDCNVTWAPAAKRIWAYNRYAYALCLKMIMCLQIQVLRQKSGVTFLEALSSDKLRLYWGQWDFFPRVLSGNWIRSVPKCFVNQTCVVSKEVQCFPCL